MAYRTPLATARGLGSAHTGTMHWWLQRVTAVALIPLSFWLISLLSLCLNAPYQQTVVWLAQPLHSVAVIAWIVAVFYHAALGLQVVIEDYVGAEGMKIIAIWLSHLFFFALAIAAVLAVFRITLAG
ncbi:MAG: succinate dehydrogenase, hydrophobic membrane anchor protein [Methylococcales bacterium]